ncbi:MAG: tRNA epoxyqueuosine(34) reductase QueG [Acidiferrobacterales bacterium]|nr:tRNA epoxyqueuosine(34) reductase QueG [Acidiferrobacterales bacterium]
MSLTDSDLHELAARIKSWGQELGFQQVGITDTDLFQAENQLNDWLNRGMHGELHYMAKHGSRRTRPGDLIDGTVRIISVRLDYFPPRSKAIREVLDDSVMAFVSRYATGRDYHKLMRKRLEKLARQIRDEVGQFSYRAFADSAPVMEKPIAQKAGLGWIGKHSNLLNRRAGSWFFLGELYTDLPLPVDLPEADHCGSCTACITVCPTDAIVEPYVVDARRCISYLTIEYKGAIPLELRHQIGNRIFGCDDCQVVCPWNRFSCDSDEPGFEVRNQLDSTTLCAVFSWTEEEFLQKTEGSAIRRVGYEHWLRNIAVALGNAQSTPEIIKSLRNRKDDASELVREHVKWALERHAACIS